MDDNIASLTSSDDFWGAFLVISTLVVLVGIIGEAVDLTTLLDKYPKTKRFVAIAAFIILTIGVAGELLGESKTISIGDQIAGVLNEKAGRANERAGQANERAGKLEKEAADANARAADLEKKAAELTKESAALMADNLRVQKIISPRRAFLLHYQRPIYSRSEAAGIQGDNSAIESYS
jgi:hypothetical protein